MASGYVIEKRRREIIKAVVAFIVDEIDDQELKPGDRLPGTRELIGKFHTNSEVICDARKTLVELGFITVVRSGAKVGTYVA